MNTKETVLIHKEIAIVGLGKMGAGVAQNLHDHGWHVVAYNRSPEKTQEFAKRGIDGAYSYKEMASKLQSVPRVIWLMLPAGKAFDDVVFGPEGIVSYLSEGDILIDAANSLYKDAVPRAEKLSERGIHYVDIGVSGGPHGARHGACLMIGGSKELFTYLEPLYQDVSAKDAYAHFPGVGAGHFAKMVHNGIEYGMMQAIGEGFEILKKSTFSYDLKEVTRIYNNKSVIESRLIGWLEKAYEEQGTDLEGISGSVAGTGEGQWTVEAGHELDIDTPVIGASCQFRIDSQEKPSYTGKVVSALRGQFGGHAVKDR